jgi:hypothetical protein
VFCAKANVRHGDAATSIDDERQRYGPAVQVFDFLGSSKNLVVDLFSRDIRPDGSPAVLVESDTEHNEISLIVSLAKFVKPRNLDAAVSALRIPKAEENHSAAKVGEPDLCTGAVQ